MHLIQEIVQSCNLLLRLFFDHFDLGDVLLLDKLQVIRQLFLFLCHLLISCLHLFDLDLGFFHCSLPLDFFLHDIRFESLDFNLKFVRNTIDTFNNSSFLVENII